MTISSFLALISFWSNDVVHLVKCELSWLLRKKISLFPYPDEKLYNIVVQIYPRKLEQFFWHPSIFSGYAISSYKLSKINELAGLHLINIHADCSLPPTKSVLPMLRAIRGLSDGIVFYRAGLLLFCWNAQLRNNWWYIVVTERTVKRIKEKEFWCLQNIEKIFRFFLSYQEINEYYWNNA